ncbi:hypothetical protein ACFOSV_16175 [Algoriphagus namhaensis]|uniref:Lipoprotein n=1 Tax=Algoriphagus namhaensis TaxID=915353 RepID=A0ABV8AUT0_9BACT
MKKLLLKPKLLIVAASMIAFASCVSETEPILVEEENTSLEILNSETSGGENLRKGDRVERAYFERFSNQLRQVDANDVPVSPQTIPAFFPGVGVGNSTHMGKAMTFLNQVSQLGENGLETVGAPVTQFFSDELSDLGITEIPDIVSSVTTDGKGNSVWFKNINNVVTPESETKFNFQAEVEIVGGTGKFEGATGEGTVVGFFDPTNGSGESTIRGEIKY